MTRTVGANAAFNAMGVLLPMAVGVITVPILLNNFGPERLGVFALAVGLIGFASIFDFGIGRALTHSVAQAVGRGCDFSAIAAHVRRTLPLVILIGGGWGGLLWAAAEPITSRVLQLDGALAEEAIFGTRSLAVSIPGLLLTTAIIGILEGLQQFKLVNLWRVPLNILTLLLPALASYAWNDVGKVIGILAALRLLSAPLWFLLIARTLPLHGAAEEDHLDTQSMWRFTAWLSVSNVIGPLMVSADRFYLASMFSPVAVAHYATPLDAIYRATALPIAAISALFPALVNVGPQSAAAARLIRGATWLMVLIWTTPILLAGALLQTLLEIWLGSEFASHTLPISRWLLIGILLNGFAHIPYALLQSAGRADLTAKLHVLEFPVYLTMLISLVNAHGVIGAAVAWTARIAFDCAALLWLAHEQFPSQRIRLTLAATTVGGSAVLLAAILFF